MIIEWLFGLVEGVSGWLAEQMPDDELPDFLVNLDGMVNDVIDNVDGIAVWADWVYILAVVSAVVLFWGLAFVVKIIRALLAHVPLFGGAG